MEVTQILKLAEAGYTAAEIKEMDEAITRMFSKQEPDPKPEPEEKADPKPEPEEKADPNPEPEEKPDPLDSIRAQLSGLTDIVEKMSKSIIMPNLDDVKPVGIEDIITNFFKEE